jgi:hypothetical protein
MAGKSTPVNEGLLNLGEDRLEDDKTAAEC